MINLHRIVVSMISFYFDPFLFYFFFSFCRIIFVFRQLLSRLTFQTFRVFVIFINKMKSLKTTHTDA